MSARLQRDIGGGAACQRTRLIQRAALGMGAAAGLCPTTTNDLARAHQHAADRRIGPDIPHTPRRKAQGMGHMGLIAHSSEAGAGRNSLTKRSKSSAAWKFL